MPPIHLSPRPLQRRAVPCVALLAALLIAAPAMAETGPLKLKQFSTSGALKKAPAHRSAKKSSQRKSARDAHADAAAKKAAGQDVAAGRKTQTSDVVSADAQTPRLSETTGAGGAETSNVADSNSFNALDAAAENDSQALGSANDAVQIVSEDTFNEIDQAGANEPVTTGAGQAESAETLAFAQTQPVGDNSSGTSWIGILFLALGSLLAAGSAVFLLFRRRPEQA